MSTATIETDAPAHIEGQEQIEEAMGERQRPLLYIPLEQIRLRANPREISPEPALEVLAASTRRMGVLQNVLVRECGPEDYELIAGERRYWACKRTGAARVPAMVIEADEETSEAELAAMAMLENTARLDLTPLEEAKQLALLISSLGYTLEAAAEHFLMKPSRAEQRPALLELPETVKGRIAAGELTLRNAATLMPIAAKSPGIAAALGERVASGAQSARALDADPAAALRRLADEECLPPSVFLVPFGPHDSVNLDEVAGRIRAAVADELVPERLREGVEEALEKVDAALAGVPPELRTALVSEADADRARAFEGLIEYREGAYRRPGVLVDAAFAADWAGEAAEMLRDDSRGEKPGGAAPRSLPPEREDPVALRKRRKDEALAASRANSHMDRELTHRFDHQEEVPLDQAVVIAALLLEAYGRDLGVGHRVIRESWLKQELRPSRGGTRVISEFPSIDEVANLLEADLRKAPTGAALIGRLFGAIASAALADQSVLGSSARPSLELPYTLGREEQLQGTAPAALWRQAEACLGERRAEELRPLFLPAERDEASGRDRLAREEDAIFDILELTPETEVDPEEAGAADAADLVGAAAE